MFRLNRFSRQAIDCPVIGSPTPVVSLFKNETLISRKTVEFFRYFFPPGQPIFDDKGIYVCVASNLFGSVNRSVEVIVQGRMIHTVVVVHVGLAFCD